MGQIIAWLRGDDADNMFLDLDSTFLLPANAILYISLERTGFSRFVPYGITVLLTSWFDEHCAPLRSRAVTRGKGAL